ncbi:leukotriene a4 hydrolase, partial [Colletotrichum plurivorum]
MCSRHPTTDINTNSNFKDVATRHTELELTIDFERTILVGRTKIALESKRAGLTEIILDTSFLTIKAASIAGNAVPWELSPPTGINGSPLHISLDREFGPGETFEITIDFETTTETTGLQWFSPSQTDDKKYPFM